MWKLPWIFFFFSLGCYAQQEPFLSNFRFHMSLFNPAYAGAEYKNSATFNSRNQWVSIENSPKTQVMTFSSERSRNIGIGVSFISNNFFAERNTASYIDVSYRLKVTENSNLFLGLKTGATFFRTNLAGLTSLSSELDPAQNSLARVNPNLGVGVYFQAPSFWFSFSVPRMFNSGNNFEFSQSSTDRVHSYLASGLSFNINDNLALKPGLLLRSVSDLGTTFDVITSLEIRNIFSIGASYRSTSTFGFLATLSLIDFFDIGYAYETPLDVGLSALKVNTHEISLRFKFGTEKSKIETEEIEN
jgi:type IX secretion system PorP/SprF family membrane protein